MSDIDTIRDAHEQVRKLIYMVKRPEDYQCADVERQSKHVDNCLAIALDRLQAQQQPNAEPVAYAYSKDYEALYDLLMRGGEAIGKDYGGRPFRAERHIDNILLGVQYSSTEVFSIVHGREAFLSSCQRLQLEWIAPSTEPRLTVEQAMDAVRREPELPGEMPDEMFNSLQGDKDAAAEAMRIIVRLTKQGIIDRLTKAAKQSA